MLLSLQGPVKPLPGAAEQADKTPAVPAGLEGLSTMLCAASQHHRPVLTLAAVHGSVRGMEGKG